MTEALDHLAEGPPLLLDGATGTELERRGAPASLPLWSALALVESPELVGRIHLDYVRAGADLITANTFRTQRRTLAHAGLAERAGELCERAISLARGAARESPRPVAVLGSAPTLEDCFRPDRVPEPAALRREHAEHAANLARAGADALLVETMNTIREAVAALRAARETGLPALVSFACGEGARLLSGEPLVDALDAVLPLQPRAVLVNCLPPSRVPACVDVLRQCGAPFGVYPNLGAPTGANGERRSEEQGPEAFAALAAGWLDAGAALVGGCCGTTPAHVARLRQELQQRERTGRMGST